MAIYSEFSHEKWWFSIVFCSLPEGICWISHSPIRPFPHRPWSPRSPHEFLPRSAFQDVHGPWWVAPWSRISPLGASKKRWRGSVLPSQRSKCGNIRDYEGLWWMDLHVMLSTYMEIPFPTWKNTPLFCLWKSARKTSGVSQDLSYHPAEAGDCPKVVMEISGSSAPKRCSLVSW